MEYLEWLISHGFVQQQADEEGAELHVLTAQGYDAHRRLVSWMRDTMKEMRI